MRNDFSAASLYQFIYRLSVKSRLESIKTNKISPQSLDKQRTVFFVVIEEKSSRSSLCVNVDKIIFQIFAYLRFYIIAVFFFACEQFVWAEIYRCKLMMSDCLV